MKNTRFMRLLVAGAAAVAVVASGLAISAPAEAATIHNRMTIKIKNVSYTLDEYNTTSKTVKYNLDCFSTSVFAKYHYTLYKTSSPGKKYLSVDVDPLHAGYLNDHYWEKVRKYPTMTEAKRVFNALRVRNIETVKNSIGYYCARDARRDETKYGVTAYVRNIQNYVVRNPTSTKDLSTVDFVTDEIGFDRNIKPLFTVVGTPASGYVASVTDRVDNYRWSYSSATGKYTETKL